MCGLVKAYEKALPESAEKPVEKKNRQGSFRRIRRIHSKELHGTKKRIQKRTGRRSGKRTSYSQNGVGLKEGVKGGSLNTTRDRQNMWPKAAVYQKKKNELSIRQKGSGQGGDGTGLLRRTK